MSFDLITLLGTLGSSLGGVAAHLFALVLAPVLHSVRQRLFPPPPPHPLKELLEELLHEVKSLSRQVESTHAILEPRDEPIVSETRD